MKLTDEQLERFRRSGIRLDKDGHFHHEGEEFRHAGFIAALWRWLDRNPDGRYVLRLDADRFVYLEVEDAPHVIRSLRIEGGRARLLLGDGSEEWLLPETLRVAESGVAYCTVKEGRFDARLSPDAWAGLADRIEEREGKAWLLLDGGRYLLGTV